MIHLLFHAGKKAIEYILEIAIKKKWHKKKILPQNKEICHPDSCEVCYGLDEIWDKNGNIVACPNKSFCGSMMKVGSAGTYFCDEKMGHEGNHKVGQIMWANVKELNDE